MSNTKNLQEDDNDCDDWFNKDEDDFVVNIPNKAAADGEGTKEEAARAPETSVRDMLDNLKFTLNDEGGNYVDSIKHATSGRTAKFELPKGAPGKYVQTIPLTKLSNILENETLSMFADIYVQKEEFIATLTKKTYGEELLLVLMKIMNKLSTIPLYETVKQLFEILVGQQQLWEQLLKYFQQPAEGERKKKKKSKIVRPTISRIDMMDVLVKFMTETRHQLPLVPQRVVEFCDKLSRILPPDDKKQIEQLHELLVQNNTMAAERPAKQISIYPTISELKDGAGPSMNLKQNIVKGKYENVEHYLEVHLHLLKEDFLIPLRTGIEKYRKFVAKNGPGISFAGESIRVHYPVKLLLPSTVNRRTAKEQLILVDLDPAERGYSTVSARYKRLALSNTKRFMNGSMVLFTDGPELNELVVAVISNRDAAQLLNGYIYVELIRMERQQQENEQSAYGMNLFNRPLLMIESEIFFEPYHQTFNALGRLREDTFPLKSYIVDVTFPSKGLPRYLSQSSSGHLFNYGGIQFDLKKPDEWPAVALTRAAGMNASQYEAFRMALTNQFTLIQGPPGTGKTFIGLRIVETLLANTGEQILLICLTNHALDQFLCGVTRYTDSIVRMGGQSKHPLLDKYNVKQLQEDERIDRRLRISYYNVKQEYLKLVERFDALQQEQETSDSLSRAMVQCMAELVDASRRLNELSQLSTLKLIQGFRVVAMTTTFAARNRTLLELLRTPIVVIEEAAEVLEAHIVSTLTRHTAQCVLIGDHKQLRPTTSTYVLSRHYRMDLSLFERMINNRFSAAMMTVQHRMRPEMADLLRPTIYPILEDADSVTARPDVTGMMRNLYFLTHNYPEGGESADSTASDDGGDEKSKKNLFECRFLLALCEYLLAHGTYNVEDIVILTAYNGQMLQFVAEKKNRPTLHGIRIAVIDNYQGEECKIVLLSLVRSGSANGGTDTIGFLAHENRICVALSRAREGLYMVGNMSLLAKCSKTWSSIERKLRDKAAIGDTMPLQCVTHGQAVEVKLPEDFGELKDVRCICGVQQK
ncbi:NFX1-type zinc finger-containing protein 1 [Anopheles maculipalpis]|uniref:NFX1-type zinc finger-containing protein 1 n=1 Tax=Anopheles maculipalpis TaxID=1496333 RepID=UPI002158B433|nr:NFX1-type zinc finger-containing protein 1 [Anopheles maculipalpis]